MACDPWTELELTVADLHYDLSSAAVTEFSERIRSTSGFVSEDEKAEQSWESMMKRVNDHHHDIFISNLLKPYSNVLDELVGVGSS